MTLVPVVALPLVAVVHAVPVLGIVGDKGLTRLYGDAQVAPAITLLLRHRAAVFATLAGLSIAAIVVTTWQVPVLLFALGSVVSFVALWLASRERFPAINRVAYVDLALTPIILAGLIAAWTSAN